MVEFKEGDIYRWRYTPERTAQIRRYHSEAYWCKSQIAVVTRSGLTDTYWGGMSDNQAHWSNPEDAEADIELEYVGNFSDLQKISEYQSAYYDDSDIINLNHANSPTGNLYIRKGAKRSREKMLAVAKAGEEKALDAIRAAGFTRQRYRELVVLLESGADLEAIYL